MTADIPSWVREVQPQVVRVPLTAYATGGELFATEKQMETFFTESWKRWRDVLEEYGTPPHVFLMDFEGVRTLDPNNASSGLIFVLANYIGREKPVHVAFDNLGFEGENNPWQSLNQTLEYHIRKGGVAVARREGEERYQLIGSRRFTKGRWQDIFTRLAFEKDWVEGNTFTKKDLGLRLTPKTQQEYLHLMAKKGIVLQKNSGRFSYFRSLV